MTTEKTLKIRHKLSYGRNLYSPINDEAKEILALISPYRKSFTIDQIERVKALGYTVEILPMHVPGVTNEKP